MKKEEIIELAKKHGYKDLPTVRLAYSGFNLHNFTQAVIVAATTIPPMSNVDAEYLEEDYGYRPSCCDKGVEKFCCPDGCIADFERANPKRK